jgi:putative tricarboxylic transport membrane protein
VTGLVLAVLATCRLAARADWHPEHNVDLVAGAGPGGGIDLTARLLQKIMYDRKLVSVPVSVVNKPGGGGAVAWSYLGQHAGEGELLAITVPGILTNHITGKSPVSYKDVTPLVQLLSDYVVWTVRTDSPLKTGKDMIERLKADPGSVSIAVGIGLGTPNHMASVMAAKAGGVDIKKLRFVVLKSSGESVAAALGGHVDVVASSPLSAAKLVEAGKLRPIATSSPVRQGAPYANAPTWKEMGIDVTLANWRGIIGPKGMKPEQIRYWENVFAAVTQSDEWKAAVKKNLWRGTFMKSDESRAFLDEQDGKLREVLQEIGLAK